MQSTSNPVMSAPLVPRSKQNIGRRINHGLVQERSQNIQLPYSPPPPAFHKLNKQNRTPPPTPLTPEQKPETSSRPIKPNLASVAKVADTPSSPY